MGGYFSTIALVWKEPQGAKMTQVEAFKACRITYFQISLCCECQSDNHVTKLAVSHITSKDHAWTTSSTTHTQEESLCTLTVWVWNLSLCSHSSWSNWINSCMSACVVTYTWIAFGLTQAHPKMMQHPTSFILRNSTTNKGSTKHPSQPRWVYNWLSSNCLHAGLV